MSRFSKRNLLNPLICRYRRFSTSSSSQNTEPASSSDEPKESSRMKQFHEKLKLESLPRIGPRERFVDLVLVNIDPKSGELLTNTEKEPTKWGDWQHGGRVSDF